MIDVAVIGNLEEEARHGAYHGTYEECPFTNSRDLVKAAEKRTEEYCPPGALMSEDQVNGHYGPTLIDEAEAPAATWT